MARGCGSDRRIRIVEIRAVEGVEHFPAEAQFRPLADLKVAVDPEIGVEVSGSNQNKICRVAKSELPRRRERIEIEPAVNGALTRGEIAVADTIRALRAAAGRIRDGAAQSRRKVRSGVHGPGAGKDPIADHMTHRDLSVQSAAVT